MLQHPDSDSILCYFALRNFIFFIWFSSLNGIGSASSGREDPESGSDEQNRTPSVIDPTIPHRPEYQIDQANGGRGMAVERYAGRRGIH